MSNLHPLTYWQWLTMIGLGLVWDWFWGTHQRVVAESPNNSIMTWPGEFGSHQRKWMLQQPIRDAGPHGCGCGPLHCKCGSPIWTLAGIVRMLARATIQQDLQHHIKNNPLINNNKTNYWNNSHNKSKEPLRDDSGGAQLCHLLIFALSSTFVRLQGNR